MTFLPIDNAEPGTASFVEMLAWHFRNGTHPSGTKQPWSYQALAEATFYSERTVRSWMRGKALPSNINRLTKILFGDREDHMIWRLELVTAYHRERMEKFGYSLERVEQPTLLFDTYRRSISKTSRPVVSRAIPDVPSPFDYAWSSKGTVVLKSSSANSPRFPFKSSAESHAQRLEACRTLATELADSLDKNRINVRDDYCIELIKYLARLPTAIGNGNIILADASARILRDLFAAESDILPTSFAVQLKITLEQHIALRPFYPEIEEFYRDVRTGYLQAPLPLDAVAEIVRGIEAHTPDIFDPSVASAINEADTTGPTGPSPAPVDVTLCQPLPPPDPLGELDAERARDFQVAGTVNKLWGVFSAGEKVPGAVAGWKVAYDTLAPHVALILHWLAQFLGRP